MRLHDVNDTSAGGGRANLLHLPPLHHSSSEESCAQGPPEPPQVCEHGCGVLRGRQYSLTLHRWALLAHRHGAGALYSAGDDLVLVSLDVGRG
eukprot:394515-Hanusia_phi.AAC.1